MPPFRTDRLYQVDGRWYFVTREKSREGPYDNRIDASLGVQRYVSSVRASI
jgi:hypothetical protein